MAPRRAISLGDQEEESFCITPPPYRRYAEILKETNGLQSTGVRPDWDCEEYGRINRCVNMEHGAPWVGFCGHVAAPCFSPSPVREPCFSGVPLVNILRRGYDFVSMVSPVRAVCVARFGCLKRVFQAADTKMEALRETVAQLERR